MTRIPSRRSTAAVLAALLVAGLTVSTAAAVHSATSGGGRRSPSGANASRFLALTGGASAPAQEAGSKPGGRPSGSGRHSGPSARPAECRVLPLVRDLPNPKVSVSVIVGLPTDDSKSTNELLQFRSDFLEEAFEFLDAPIRIVGALDTPVPYSPPLEEEFLPSEVEIEQVARELVAY